MPGSTHQSSSEKARRSTPTNPLDLRELVRFAVAGLVILTATAEQDEDEGTYPHYDKAEFPCT